MGYSLLPKLATIFSKCSIYKNYVLQVIKPVTLDRQDLPVHTKVRRIPDYTPPQYQLKLNLISYTSLGLYSPNGKNRALMVRK